MTAMGHPSVLMNHHHYEANLNKLPRAQSSLELLSQTAIEIESANSSPRSLIHSRATSPTATRVTPTAAAETLVLPELVHKTTSTAGMMVGSFPLYNENENGNNNKVPILKHHYEYHQHAPLMPRPDADYGTISSLATLMRQPSGLYVTLLSGSSHQAGGGGGGANFSSFPDHIYRAASFSSSSGRSIHQATTNTTATTIAADSTSTTTAEPSSSTSASAISSSSSSSDSNRQYDQSQPENAWLRRELAAKDSTIATLQIQVQNLAQEIRQLRQLPTGKISQIPLEDMLSIMREYGSEVSDMSMPRRKSFVQKASVVRQFRRWNPHFLEWFEHVNGRWVPKLGRDGELRRRQQARQEAVTHRGSSSRPTTHNKAGTSKRSSSSSTKNSSITSSSKKSKSS